MPSCRSRFTITVATVAVACAGGLAVAGQDGRDRAHLSIDATAPLFSAPNLLPGQRTTACAGVENTGGAPGRAALYAPGVSGELAEHLALTVTRRERCGAAHGTRLYRGTLAGFPHDRAHALVDPAVASAGDRRAYDFVLQLGSNPAAEGLSASWNWHLAVESLPVASTTSTRSAAAACAGVRPGPQVATARISRRVRAVLVARSSRAGVELTTGLRVRGDKTLRSGNWARVRYRVNGRRVGDPEHRPFRTHVPASRLTPGANRIAVAVQPRRGPKRTTAFTLHATPNGSGTCALDS